MSDRAPNPYQPPATRVADPPALDAAPRPRIVTIAVWLLWGQIALELIDAVLDIRDDSQQGSLVVVASAVTITLVGMVCWLIFMIGRRRNWARIAFAFLFALAMFAQVWNWQGLLNGPLRDLLMIVAQFGLQLAAMILLFRPQASAWFRSRNQ
jgi:hypothetical protein